MKLVAKWDERYPHLFLREPQFATDRPLEFPDDLLGRYEAVMAELRVIEAEVRERTDG